MEYKAKIETTLCLITLIAAALVMVPTVQSSPETYGPRLDEMYGRFIESPTAQRFALETGEVDLWFDIREPATVRELQDAGFQVSLVEDTFLYYHIDFNLRDQLDPGAQTPGATPWRTESAPGDYYTYSGVQYENYVPLDDLEFRQACALCIPKAAIEAEVYEGLTGSAIDSLVPAAQRKWYNPLTAFPAYNPGDPTDPDPQPGTAVQVLRDGGYVFDPGADNPAPDPWGLAPPGNWIDPATGEPMNHITFAGVTLAIAPRSWGRDDYSAREMRAIGLPIQHEEVSFSYLTDTMMDYYQFDMYALGWGITRNPDHLYSFFHSSNDFVPEGYNIPGVRDPTLDALLYTIQHSLDEIEVRQASLAAQDLLATLCVSLPTVTRPGITASAKAGAPGHTDTIIGVVDSPGYQQDHSDTYNSLRWESMVTGGNPYGVGGSFGYIVGSEPTNYHPAFASTVDEHTVTDRLYDGMIEIDPYTHEDIPGLATTWTIDPWTAPGPVDGMNITFWIRDNVYWHDGTQFTANDAEFALHWVQDNEIGRAFSAWQYFDHCDVHDDYTISVYIGATSLWILYDVAYWTCLLPEHIYSGTGVTFRPETTVNPVNNQLTCLIGTGPFVYRQDSVWGLGGFAHLTAYRPGASPVSTHWYKSVETLDAQLENQFNWAGDIPYELTNEVYTFIGDGYVNATDTDEYAGGKAWGKLIGDPKYNVYCDISGPPGTKYHENDGSIDGFDVYVVAQHFGLMRERPGARDE